MVRVWYPWLSLPRTKSHGWAKCSLMNLGLRPISSRGSTGSPSLEPSPLYSTGSNYIRKVIEHFLIVVLLWRITAKLFFLGVVLLISQQKRILNINSESKWVSSIFCILFFWPKDNNDKYGQFIILHFLLCIT